MTKARALAEVRKYFEEGHFRGDLARRVAYRSVSGADANDADLLPYYAEVLEPDLTAMGFSCRTIDNPVPGGSPFLFAERVENPDFVTMLTYGHGDVVPGMDEQWDAGLSPWQLVDRNDAWYGRGVADNKGQHLVNLTALREVIKARNGKLGFNVKALFELGEERSSPGLRQVCRQHADILSADVFIASDGPRVSKEQPTMFLGSRGSAIFELTCSLRSGALHSGNWGGIMKNPAVVLSGAISSLVDGKGRIQVAGLLPPPIPFPVRDALSKLKIDSESLGRKIDEDWGDPTLSAAERLLGWNSLEVLTLKAGNPEKPANAIPPAASAFLQLRFVVGTAWESIEEVVSQHLDQAGYTDVQVRLLRGSPATRLDPASPWVEWANEAFRSVSVREPAVVPNLGGTVPNDAFSDILGLPTIWIPHSYPGCKQHAPNEHLPIAIAAQGLAIMTSVFWELGEPAARLARTRQQASA